MDGCEIAGLSYYFYSIFQRQLSVTPVEGACCREGNVLKCVKLLLRKARCDECLKRQQGRCQGPFRQSRDLGSSDLATPRGQ